MSRDDEGRFAVAANADVQLKDALASFAAPEALVATLQLVYQIKWVSTCAVLSKFDAKVL